MWWWRAGDGARRPSLGAGGRDGMARTTRRGRAAAEDVGASARSGRGSEVPRRGAAARADGVEGGRDTARHRGRGARPPDDASSDPSMRSRGGAPAGGGRARAARRGEGERPARKAPPRLGAWPRRRRPPARSRQGSAAARSFAAPAPALRRSRRSRSGARGSLRNQDRAEPPREALRMETRGEGDLLGRDELVVDRETPDSGVSDIRKSSGRCAPLCRTWCWRWSWPRRHPLREPAPRGPDEPARVLGGARRRRPRGGTGRGAASIARRTRGCGADRLRLARRHRVGRRRRRLPPVGACGG